MAEARVASTRNGGFPGVVFHVPHNYFDRKDGIEQTISDVIGYARDGSRHCFVRQAFDGLRGRPGV